jgi:hypothetical protein
MIATEARQSPPVTRIAASRQSSGPLQSDPSATVQREPSRTPQRGARNRERCPVTRGDRGDESAAAATNVSRPHRCEGGRATPSSGCGVSGSASSSQRRCRMVALWARSAATAGRSSRTTTTPMGGTQHVAGTNGETPLVVDAPIAIASKPAMNASATMQRRVGAVRATSGIAAIRIVGTAAESPLTSLFASVTEAQASRLVSPGVLSSRASSSAMRRCSVALCERRRAASRRADAASCANAGRRVRSFFNRSSSSAGSDCSGGVMTREPAKPATDRRDRS